MPSQARRLGISTIQVDVYERGLTEKKAGDIVT
jgi:hypothetical protein